MATGSPGGLEIARNLMPRCWVGAHDERKVVEGWMTRGIGRKDFEAKDISRRLGGKTEVMTLEAGMEVRVDSSGDKLEPKSSSFIERGEEVVK